MPVYLKVVIKTAFYLLLSVIAMRAYVRVPQLHSQILRLSGQVKTLKLHTSMTIKSPDHPQPHPNHNPSRRFSTAQPARGRRSHAHEGPPMSLFSHGLQAATATASATAAPHPMAALSLNPAAHHTHLPRNQWPTCPNTMTASRSNNTNHFTDIMEAAADSAMFMSMGGDTPSMVPAAVVVSVSTHDVGMDNPSTNPSVQKHIKVEEVDESTENDDSVDCSSVAAVPDQNTNEDLDAVLTEELQDLAAEEVQSSTPTLHAIY